MQTIQLYDTLTRTLRRLQAADGERYRFYVCGPTVYGPAHIGNFLTFLRFDVLFRTLRQTGYNPLYVRNITDVDDKTIRGAMENGQSLADFTAKWTQRFHEDCEKLNLLQPDIEPKATEHIQEQIELITKLVDKGFAYPGGDGSVYFKVLQFEDYGKLSHFDPKSLLSQSTNSAGTQNLSDEYEREAVADFALWKAFKEEDGSVFWDSPYGRGRPGWHLECSAMSMRYLGENFDLHGGGEDLCFPHHENEIAQSEAATGKTLANHWMHGIHLLVEGKKMSKSLGNFYTLTDLIEKGFEPMEIRLALLGGHYRQQFNFTLSGLSAARAGLKKLRLGAARWYKAAGIDIPQKSAEPKSLTKPSGPFQPALDALLNDLNTPAALGALFRTLKEVPPESVADPAQALPGLESLLFCLGLEIASPTTEAATESAPAEIVQWAQQRWEAKKARNFALADELRAKITAAGWQVLDSKDGYTLEKAASA
jgi:cysteinyl-tRNA synthetase